MGTKRKFQIKEIRTMKKIIVLILLVMVVSGGLVFAQEKSGEEIVTKTYFLKHVSPQTVDRVLRAYHDHNPSYDRNGDMITVKMYKSNVAEFERLLKRLDVEKKKILLRIFTVIASQEGKSSDIENEDLNRVLSELKKVLSFKAFRLDGVSALTVTDGQDSSQIRLASKSSLLLRLGYINIKKDSDGKHILGFRFDLKQETEIDPKEGKSSFSTLIASETSVKENGYLVAGVSKIGDNGDSLVLVINAEIK